MDHLFPDELAPTMDVMMMKKVVLITNIPNPYRVPLFNTLNSLLKNDGICLKVIFGAAGYSRRLFKIRKEEMLFNYTILTDTPMTRGNDGEKTIFLYQGLISELRKEKPDLIIVSGFSPATIKVLLYKIASGTPYLIWNGSIENPGKKISIMTMIRQKLLCRFSDGFISYGKMAAGYLQKLGAEQKRIVVATNTVDTTFFREETQRLRKSHREPVTVFLVIGYLVPRKEMGDLLEAVRLVAQSRKDFRVDILGEGTARGEMEEFVRKHHLDSIVNFHGFVQKGDLPVWLAQSSALLFQTGYDIWGLVVNEAMAAGVPVLSSPNAGATYDLIRDGENGFVVDFRNHAHAAKMLQWVMDHPEDTAEMGKRASEFIQKNASLENASNKFKEAIQMTLNSVPEP